MPLTNSDKYLPELTELTTIADSDLFYIVGSDYGSTTQDIRGLTNPCFFSAIKLINYGISAAECDGRWFTNKGSVAPIILTLPAVADNLIVAVYIETSKDVYITPQPTDSIAQITSGDGISIKANIIGSSIILRATSNDWFVIRKSGTWEEV